MSNEIRGAQQVTFNTKSQAIAKGNTTTMSELGIGLNFSKKEFVDAWNAGTVTYWEELNAHPTAIKLDIYNKYLACVNAGLLQLSSHMQSVIKSFWQTYADKEYESKSVIDRFNSVGSLEIDGSIKPTDSKPAEAGWVTVRRLSPGLLSLLAIAGFKSEPWLHCAIVYDGIVLHYTIYVWDTRHAILADSVPYYANARRDIRRCSKAAIDDFRKIVGRGESVDVINAKFDKNA
jgi:hypothetical protein